ncbi:MAG: hypothetical protein L0Z62_03345 [Gemmataceae bacterium]|nr:hypothetical protein [Gemmataceae bacterium]
MSWWKTALYDTCSIITLDKLLLERASLARHFPTSIAALAARKDFLLGTATPILDAAQKDTTERAAGLVPAGINPAARGVQPPRVE